MKRPKKLPEYWDWTQNWEGKSNCSPMFENLRSKVEEIIRDNGYALANNDAGGVALIIMANLAHVHHLVPAEKKGEK